MAFDYLVVGAGFAGSVVAERLAAGANKKVLLIDRRPHLGGNAYDRLDEHGVLIHQYGPHIFHTNSLAVFSYLSQFTAWRDYEHRVLASVDAQLVPIPINLTTLERLYGRTFTHTSAERFLRARSETREIIRTSEDVVVSKIGRELYEKFFKGYTRKQWGVDPSQLDSTVAGRIPTRTNRDDRYFTDTYQAIPRDGYTAMFERMTAHKNVTTMLSTDLADVKRTNYDQLIYTGPIDAFFDYRFGKLPYRSLTFKFESHPVERFQATGTVNYPNEHEYTRITEFKHLTGQVSPTTTICYEYPQPVGDPYYPVPSEESGLLYAKYRSLAAAAADVHFVGRLATYKYYNMDQVVAQALSLFERLVGASGASLGAAITGGL